MKKLLLVLCATMVAGVSFSQNAEILIDKVDADGFRIIGTKPVNCRNGMSDRHPMMFSLLCCKQGDKSAWSIEIDFPDVKPFTINKGAIMLIKLNDAGVIELKQMKDASDVQDVVGTYNSMAGIRTYTMRASYEVSPDQLAAISKAGVAKIRVERASDTFDVEYKKDKVGPAIASAYALVTSTLGKSKDLRSDF